MSDAHSHSRGTHGVLTRDCYTRYLKSASSYKRAAGYLSASVFRIAPRLVREFLDRGGGFEFVCNNQFGKRDYDACVAGIWQPAIWRARKLSEIIGVDPDWPWELLSWCIANRRAAIRVAVKANGEGIYHEKFGVWIEGQTPIAAFEGSVNETYAGYAQNFERATVYDCALGGTGPACRLLGEFESLWSNSHPDLRVVSIHEAIRSDIIKVSCEDSSQIETSDAYRLRGRPVELDPELLRLPDRFNLRDYQSQAIGAWFSAGGKGILELATGAGKTFTALAALTKLYDSTDEPLAIVVVAPYIHLVEQWNAEADTFGLRPIVCLGSQAHWRPFARSAVYSVNAGKRRLASFFVTNATFCSDVFQDLIASLQVRTAIVVDEVHNLGAPKLASALPDRVQIRMGLSATPTRWLDQEGTDRLSRYFGPVVYRFGLAEALSHEPPVLCPYRYVPILVPLDDDEQEQYIELTSAIGRCMSDLDHQISEMGKALLIKRSRLVASAKNKLPALRKAIQPFTSSAHCLVYCGDGSIEFGDCDDSQNSLRQIDSVTRILGHELGMSVAQFTADTSKDERQAILGRFARADLQAMVAIRCLDEGVNIPEVTRAFILASSSNPRQFIQRRGRILRRSPGKTCAEIYDFVVRPPNSLADKSAPGHEASRSLIRNELRRVSEFASLARNAAEARQVLLPLLQKWDLLHL